MLPIERIDDTLNKIVLVIVVIIDFKVALQRVSFNQTTLWLVD